MEKVILVNEKDEAIGEMEKLAAHKAGLLHRAFSIFIFNNKGELLLQKRANNKYHSAGLWANTCCSHPRPGEIIENAAHRRLKEEIGFDCPLVPWFNFIYTTTFSNGLTEHEFDHVFYGFYDGIIPFNTEEISETKYISLPALKKQITHTPEEFTSWLLLCLEKIEQIPLNKTIL